MKGKFQQLHFLLKALILVICMLLCSIAAMGLWLLFTGGSQTTNSLKIMQLLQSIGVMILPCLLCMYLWYAQPLTTMGLNKKITWSAAVSVIVFMLIALPFINLLSEWNRHMELPAFLSGVEVWMKESEDAANLLTERFLAANTIYGLSFNILLMAILPAFSEELLFRGILLHLFSERGKMHVAIWACAILFSAIHLQFYGFIPRMLLGALFGYLYVWSGSLWLPILAHFVNNAFAVISYYIVEQNNWNEEMLDSFGFGTTLWAGILSGILCCAGIYLLRRSLTMSNASSRKSIGN